MSDERKDSESALERYIQKKQKEEASSASDSIASPPIEPGLTQPAPIAPSGSAGATAATVAAMAEVPAGFWIRFVASIIDSLIVSAVTWPVGFAIGLLSAAGGSETGSGRWFLTQVSSFAIGAVVSFAYFGWFYKNKGASLGKMALNLKVIDSETGRNLDYGRTFAREVICKQIFSTYLTLTIGYWIAGFREDKKALHDLMASTQVVRLKRIY